MNVIYKKDTFYYFPQRLHIFKLTSLVHQFYFFPHYDQHSFIIINSLKWILLPLMWTVAYFKEIQSQ